MDSEINRLMSALKKQQISRRTFLSSLTALAVAGFSVKGRHNSAFAADEFCSTYSSGSD